MEAYLVKKCPFCGHEIYTESYPEWYEGYCQNKRCFLYGMDFDFLDLEKWNTRPIEDALEARVAELEAENEKLKAAQEWISVEDDLPKEDYAESGATYDLVVQYVNKPAFVVVANYYNKLWCDASTDDWVWIPNEFAKFWRERPLPPC